MGHLMPKDSYSNISDISLDYLINDIHIKGLIFDFDGTLADTAPGIVNSLEYTSETLGLPKLGENEYTTMIGPAFRQGFARLYPNIDQQTLTQAEQLFFQHYFDYGLTQVAFYPHIFETLSRLQQTG